MLTRLLRNRGDDMSTKIISAEKIESAKSAIKNAVDKANKAGYSKGFESGKQEEYKNFWSPISNQTYFAYAFGSIFNFNNFKPPSTIIPKSQEACKVCEHNINGTCDKYGGSLPAEKNIAVAQGMFQGSRIRRALTSQDVDWLCVPNMDYAFASSNVTEVTGINAKNCKSMKHLFWWCSGLKKVEFTGYGRVTDWTKAFYRCLALEHIRFFTEYDESGKRTESIRASIDFGDCSKLTFNSIASIFGALSDDVSNCTVTLSLAAVDKAFERVEGANDGSTTYGWLNVSTKKTNWKVVLR